MHALLGHLHTAGFHGTPRPLGLDERAREVLTFIPGVVAWPDSVGLLDHDEQLRKVAPDYIARREDTWRRALLG